MTSPHHAASAIARVPGRVVSHERLGGSLWLTITVPGWPGATPGQFALLQAGSSSCFLPRAFSVAAQDDERVSFLVAPVGTATKELETLRRDDPLWVTGPLGNGFDLAQVCAAATPAVGAAAAQVVGDGEGAGLGARLVIVAGGVGAAPFPLLLDSLTSQAKNGCLMPPEVLVLVGFRDGTQAKGSAPVEGAAARLRAAGGSCILELCTEDGSQGSRQLVTELFAARVRVGDRVVACGPRPMMEAVWRVCTEAQVDQAWFSLETAMACGVGSCHGCVVVLADGRLARVCREGPVFAGAAIFGRISS